jgi:hypothetical protein
MKRGLWLKMDLSWLKQELTVALIVLALWATGAAASGNPLHAREPDHLFLLSLEELMEVPIDTDCSHLVYDRDFVEPSASALAVEGDLCGRNDEGVPIHDIPVKSISCARDSLDYGRNHDD